MKKCFSVPHRPEREQDRLQEPLRLQGRGRDRGLQVRPSPAGQGPQEDNLLVLQQQRHIKACRHKITPKIPIFNVVCNLDCVKLRRIACNRLFR